MPEKTTVEDLTFSVDQDGCIRLGDGTICGNKSPTRAAERAFQSEQESYTAEDMAAYSQVREGDPDFHQVRQAMVELTESGHVDPDDARQIAQNPKVFLREYFDLKQKMIADQDDNPRQYQLSELKQQLADHDEQFGKHATLQRDQLLQKIAATQTSR